MNEVELEIENMGITLDPVEWYRTIIDGKVNANTPTHSFVPDGVVNYLGPVFQGYMMGPTAVYENQPLTAKTRIVHDLEEFRTTIADLERPAFLYMPMYIPTQPLFRKVDENGEFVELDPPETIEGAWRIRYSVLGEL
jgi:hypothetical protein